MFITEEQLIKLKYQLPEYHDLLLAEIFLIELNNFNATHETKISFMRAIKPFYHRFINGACDVKFIDDSRLLFKPNKNEEDIYSGKIIKDNYFSLPD